MGKSVKLFPQDTVTTVTTEVIKGETITVACEEDTFELAASENIPIYHKVALCDIPKGQEVIKYGESIGVATHDIAVGSLVHTQNLSSKCQTE